MIYLDHIGSLWAHEGLLRLSIAKPLDIFAGDSCNHVLVFMNWHLSGVERPDRSIAGANDTTIFEKFLRGCLLHRHQE